MKQNSSVLLRNLMRFTAKFLPDGSLYRDKPNLRKRFYKKINSTHQNLIAEDVEVLSADLINPKQYNYKDYDELKKRSRERKEKYVLIPPPGHYKGNKRLGKG